MQFPENWLRTWINPAITTDKMIELFTALGHELDETGSVAGDFSNVLVGEVLTVEAHPDADKLRVCKVSVPPHVEPLQIVCGASNVRAGLKVAVAMLDAKLDNGAITIKRSRLRGVESEGMLCSASELGLAETSQGILELPADAPLGEDLRRYLHLEDKFIRLDLTPNRADCLSIQGLARELSVATGEAYKEPFSIAMNEFKEQSCPHVFIEDTVSCGRYVGRLISGIDNSITTPLWLQERLRRSGLRSVSPVVDVTNYVMLELGQPLHAFDADKLAGDIHVRTSHSGESLQLLDGKTITLDEKSLVIADDKKVLALAGVMGGLESAVDANTKTLFLESAYFTPRALAGQARRYGLHTDSSHRFERGVDWQLQKKAIERATELLLNIVGGTASQMIEVTSLSALPPTVNISLRKSRIHRILGVTLDSIRIEKILTGLGMKLNHDDEHTWQVRVPSFRGDITAEIDLIEEIARVYGYDSIEPNLPQQQLKLDPTQTEAKWVTRVGQWLMARDYQELITYSFVDKNSEGLLFPDRAPLALANPISPELAVMRTSLWSGLLQAVRYNQNRQQERLRFFEIGACYQAGEKDKPCREETQIAGVIAGTRWPLQWGYPQQKVDFFDIKGDVVALLQQFNILAECEFKPEISSALHPKQGLAIHHKGQKIGEFGALHPSLLAKFDLTGPILLFELTLKALSLATLPKFATLSKYPAIRRDIAFSVSNDISYAQIESTIRSKKAPFEVVELQLFDVYQGQGVATGHKSLAVAMMLQHSERTLVDEEVNDWVASVVNALSTELAAVLRM